jgi:hypothetical protein
MSDYEPSFTSEDLPGDFKIFGDFVMLQEQARNVGSPGGDV